MGEAGLGEPCACWRCGQVLPCLGHEASLGLRDLDWEGLSRGSGLMGKGEREGGQGPKCSELG